MSVEFFDGFDYGNVVSTRWDFNSATNAYNSPGRYGSGNYHNLRSGNLLGLLNVSAGVNSRSLLSQSASKTVGFAFMYDIATTVYTIATFTDSGNTQVDLRTNSSGNLVVTRNGTTLATSSSTLINNVWYYIEFTATINSSGSYTVKVNNSSTGWISGSGNTQATANAYTDGFKFGGGSFSNSFNIDDVYITNDTTMLGEVRCIGDEPNADGDSLQWTPNSGTSHFSRVNSADADSSYISDSTVSDLDLVKYPSFSSGGASIVALQCIIGARKDDAGTRDISPETKIGGTVYDGSSVGGLVSSYRYYANLMLTNPNSSAAWTDTDATNVQLGVKVLS